MDRKIGTFLHNLYKVFDSIISEYKIVFKVRFIEMMVNFFIVVTFVSSSFYFVFLFKIDRLKPSKILTFW